MDNKKLVYLASLLALATAGAHSRYTVAPASRVKPRYS
jgi:hypothetical protein